MNASAAARRRLRRTLADSGLTGRHSESATTEQGHSRLESFSHVLDDLGPLYSAFGQYLSQRPDLTPLGSCLTMAIQPHTESPTPTESVHSLLRSAGDPWRNLRGSIDPSPVGFTPIYQWHLAEIDEEPHLVKILRPEFERQARTEVQALEGIGGLTLWDDPRLAIDFQTAYRDFRFEFDRCLDLGSQAELLAEIEGWLPASDELELAGDIAEYRHQRVVVSRLPEGESLARRLESTEEGNRADIARRLAAAWLHLALIDGVCLDVVDPCDIVLQPDGGIAILGGCPSLPDRPSRNQLLRYLTASAQHEPDRACSILTRLSDTKSSHRSIDYLRIQLRQATPFRDGGWYEPTSGERLAHTMFLHWRLARSSGYEPKAQLAAFQRGAAQIVHLAHSLAPSTDSFEHAVADTRVVAAAVETRKRFGPSTLDRWIRRMLSALDHVAHNSEEVVRRFTANEGDEYTSPSDLKPKRKGPLIAILATVISTSWLFGSFSPEIANARWLEPVAAVALLILLVAYILVVERSRTRPG